MPLSVTYPFPVHQISLGNGASISYMDVGKGPQTIVFIHGLANYAPVWLQNINFLKENYRCIALDLPGNGLSAPAVPQPAYSIQWLAHCLIDFIGRLGLQDICLCGHSMGGQIAITALLEEPRCANKLALIAPAGLEKFSFTDRLLLTQGMNMMGWLATEEQQLHESLKSSFYKPNPATEKITAELSRLMAGHQQRQAYKSMVQQCIAAMIDEPVLENLKNVHVPVLLVFGENDALIPNRLLHRGSTRSLATAAVRHFKNAQLFLVKDAGHFVQWEKAATVNKLLAGFMEKS